jgi:hypothetical protein
MGSVFDERAVAFRDVIKMGRTQLGAFVLVSGLLKRVAVKLSKICNDLRLMSSGPRVGLGEINLPPMQAGSSIMPGKVNPVIPEVVNQVAFQVIGYDLTVTMAAEAGQLQLNAFEPVIAHSLLTSVQSLDAAARTLAERCVAGITTNSDHLAEQVRRSSGLATALTQYLGYEQSALLAKEGPDPDLGPNGARARRNARARHRGPGASDSRGRAPGRAPTSGRPALSAARPASRLDDEFEIVRVVVPDGPRQDVRSFDHKMASSTMPAATSRSLTLPVWGPHEGPKDAVGVEAVALHYDADGLPDLGAGHQCFVEVRVFTAPAECGRGQVGEHRAELA